jgi:hypothetical protein
MACPMAFLGHLDTSIEYFALVLSVVPVEVWMQGREFCARFAAILEFLSHSSLSTATVLQFIHLILSNCAILSKSVPRDC